jgi:hypothetical protein
LPVTDRARLSFQAAVRNANWVLQYWECRQPAPAAAPAAADDAASSQAAAASEAVWDYSRCFPNPVCDEYGFRPSKKRKDAVQWLDVDEEEEG